MLLLEKYAENPFSKIKTLYFRCTEVFLKQDLQDPHLISNIDAFSLRQDMVTSTPRLKEHFTQSMVVFIEAVCVPSSLYLIDICFGCLIGTVSYWLFTHEIAFLCTEIEENLTCCYNPCLSMFDLASS